MDSRTGALQAQAVNEPVATMASTTRFERERQHSGDSSLMRLCRPFDGKLDQKICGGLHLFHTGPFQWRMRVVFAGGQVWRG